MARREQAARVMQAREAERTRIAGEMHDLLSHRLALISLHAGALEYRGSDPAVAREAAGVIRAAAETAVEELHEVLAVLRLPEAGTAPAPTLADVRTLADTVRATGHPVDLSLDVGPGEPGTATTGHLYRVLQESFTNAVKLGDLGLDGHGVQVGQLEQHRRQLVGDHGLAFLGDDAHHIAIDGRDDAGVSQVDLGGVDLDVGAFYLRVQGQQVGLLHLEGGFGVFEVLAGD